MKTGSSCHSPFNSSVISSSSHSSNARHHVATLNTRKIGSRLSVQLRKSQSGGFGIKIAQRANAIGLNSPIYITAILATGSAYQDGRLKEGDILLEINGKELAGITQYEVTQMLKSFAPNTVVKFVISRHTSTDTKTTELSADSPLLKPLTSPRTPQTKTEPSRINKEIVDNIVQLDGPGTHHYDIPLNDTKSAGLGLYLKFPTVDSKDLGVFIEKVITGGAAWKDGRLLPDDQILAINNINILGLSNAKATETLKAGCTVNDLKTIRLTIHRTLKSSNEDNKAHAAEQQSSGEEKPSGRFKRDGFGRRSMSEKTHAQLMAKSQKVKEERDKRQVQDSPPQVEDSQQFEECTDKSVSSPEPCWRCRALNLRVYEVPPLERPNPFATSGRRNNSFRAAIDKSHGF